MMRTIMIALPLLLQLAHAFRPVPDTMRVQFQLIHNKEGMTTHHMSQLDQEIRQEIEMEIIEEATSTDSSLSKQADRGRVVLQVALGSLAAVAAAAKLGSLPLPPGFDYTDSFIVRDLSTALLGGGLGYAYVKLCTALAAKDILQPRDSRKLIHTFSAPLYILMWPLYSPAGRFFAACVPLVNAVRLYLAASGDSGESELANAVSRSGDKKEALGGPFVYVLVLFSAISLFWRNNLVGIAALCSMAAGDGMADLVGRRLGKGNKWIFSPDKSIAGSAAFVVSATLCTFALATWLSFTGCLALPFGGAELINRIFVINVACALIELLPVGDDNWNVPISSALLAYVFLQ